MGEKTSLTLKILAAGLFTMLLVTFLFTDNFSLGEAESDSADVAGDALIGTAEGHNGPVTVAVTVDGETITDVQVTEHAETEGLADPALEEVPAAIVESNSTDVDTVSGATYTSEAIMAAVDDALAGGSGESTGAAAGETYTVEVEGHNGPLTVNVTIDGDTITAVEVTDHAETEGLADPAIAEVPAAIVENNSTDVDTVSGATVTSEAIISAVEQALEEAGVSGAASDDGAAAPGETYTAQAEGHNGPVTVDVTIDGETITAVEVTDHMETEGIADPALEEIPAAIVASNSTDVDTVSGATYASNAIISAVEQALEEAGVSNGATVAGETTTVEVEGHNGTVTVDVTIDGDTITAVEVKDHAETEGLSDPAIAEVPAAIVENNSTDVDTVSGATVTSEAIISAVEQAIEEAN